MKVRIPTAGAWLLWLIPGAFVDGFLPARTTRRCCGRQIHTLASAVPENGAEDSRNSPKSSENVVDVVLFGLGDLRVDDHLGLINALGTAASSDTSLNDDISPNPGGIMVVPLCVLTPEALSHFPGAVAHTGDTSQLIAGALAGLDARLQDLCRDDLRGGGEERALNVACWTGDDDTTSDPSLLETVLSQVQNQFGADRLRVHACDLGDADNAMEYGAYSQLRRLGRDGSQLPLEVVPWTNNLREEPWKHVQDLPDQYPAYETAYAQTPVTAPRFTKECVTPAAGSRLVTLDAFALPTGEELERCMMKVLDLDATRCSSERNTGLYATHWGGLDPSSVAEAQVLDVVQAYSTECPESDQAWFEHPLYVGRHVKRNGLSLEHAAMQWQLRGDGTFPAGNPDNWLPGESLVRFLSAPLLLGTVSPRRVWHASNKDGFLFRSPLKQVVEGREWHRLLAARNMRLDPAYQGQGETTYKYWRYQGFLVRCAETQFSPATAAASSEHREGVLLIHGFGASGTQWNKAMQELRDAGEDGGACQGLAPDLLGFGHSEKPALSYTAYLWDSQTGDFVKEVALRQNGWNSFVVGGNSIGGYTSMSAAASDAAQVGHRQLTSSGAPGTGRCTGLVLMNSAGPLPTREEVAAQMSIVDKELDLRRQTVAQVTALDGLPPCRPPPRPVARVFGSVLLAYLRPRIQSICRNLYPTDPSAVDDALCGSILRDSLDPGAVYVMMAGAKLPAPRTSNELLSAAFGGVPTTAPPTTVGGEDAAPPPGALSESVYAGPVLVAQGVLDPLNDAQDRMGRFAALRPGVTGDPIPAGHCPHDELPKEVAGSIAKWMAATRTERWTAVVSSSSSWSSTSNTPTAATAR